MAETLKIPNFPSINVLQASQLNADNTAGDTTSTPLNASDFAANQKVFIGSFGSNTGEIATVTSVLSGVITWSSPLLNNHTKYEPITILFGDQIGLWRATNVDGTTPLDASFSNLSYTNIDADQSYTLITDSAGSSSYWYKANYYNTYTSSGTSLALSYAVRGGGYGHYVSIEDCRTEAGLQDNDQINDTQIAARRDHAESEVKGALAAAGYTMPLQTAAGVFYVPQLIENITRLLVSGYVLVQDYGPIAPGSSKDGEQKITMAWELLSDIQDHSILLVDSNEQSLATVERIQFWPNDGTAQQGSDGVTPEPALFSMGKKF